MFNLLRSIFWLGVVFTAMFWNGGSPGGDLRPSEIAQSAARKAAAVAGDYCAASPMECLEAAQKLNALFEKAAAEPDFAEIPTIQASAQEAAQEAAPGPAPQRAQSAPPIPPARPAFLSSADRKAAWRGKISP